MHQSKLFKPASFLLFSFIFLVACTQTAVSTPPPTPTTDEIAEVADPTTEPTIAATEPPALTPTTAPTASPEPTATAQVDCNQQFTELLAGYGRNLTECGGADAGTMLQCPLPQSSVSSQPLKENINIQIILDASGSMGDPFGGSTRLAVAQAVLADFVDTLPADAQVSLRVYGHTGSRDEADKAVSCQGTELIYPFQPLSAGGFVETINAVAPVGWTPTGAALLAALDDFSQFDPATNSNFVYLISDGLETCDGDPAAAAAQLNSANVGVTVNVVGFAVDDETTQELQETAVNGGGTYFPANDAEALREIFIEQIDWAAWGEYRACLVDTAAAIYSEDVNQNSEAFSCSMQMVSDESADMLAAIAAGSEYAQCSQELTERIINRQNEMHGTLTREFDALINAAETEFDEQVDEAEEESAP